MSTEFEAAGGASLGALKDDGQATPSGTNNGRCRNCGHPVTGRYCENCGQLAANFHRPVWHLVTDALSDFFALDGRLMRTLPALMLRPGRVTREYLEGRRMSYVPPFRLYILSSLVFFFTIFWIGDRAGWFEERYVENPESARASIMGADEILNLSIDDVDTLTDEEIEGLRSLSELARETNLDGIANRLDAELEDIRESEDDTSAAGEAVDGNESGAENDSLVDLLNDDGSVDRVGINEWLDNMEETPPEWAYTFAMQAANAYENQKFFYAVVREWMPRFALLLLPFTILTLMVFYVFHRRIFIYDHVISALHYQSWVYLFYTTLMLLALLGLPSWPLWTAGVLAPAIYLYRLQREAYRAGRFFALVRTFTLLLVTTILVVVLLIGVIGAGVMEV